MRGKFISIKKIKIFNKNKFKYILKEIKYDSGDIIYLHSIWNMPGPWKLDVSTKKYFFNFDPLEKVKFRKNNEKNYLNIKLNNNDIIAKPGFKNQFEYFLKSFLKKNIKYNFDTSDELMNLISNIILDN